jgi:hypothetical protein
MDDFDGIDGDSTDLDDEPVEVTRDASGRAALVPRSLQGLDADARAVVSDVMRTAAAVHQEQANLALLVADARERGVSWSGIGWAVGTTGEAARQRWGSV